MKPILKNKTIITLILIIFAASSIFTYGISARSAGNFGMPGFSLSFVESYGVVGEPYVFTNDRINHPMGLFVDAGGALYVAEQNGFRVMKFDADGNYEMSFGEVGQPWHHDHYLYRPQGVVVDDDGHVWVVIPNAIKEFDSDGNILQIFPDENPWEHGEGNDRLDGPFQLIFSNENTQLFVSEMYNHRVQIFNVDADNNTLTYANTINSDDVVEGDFDHPHGLAFDSAGRLYIMDKHNHRVLRCELIAPNWTCDTFFGTTGEEGNGPDKLRWAEGIYIDGADNIFIADGGNRRVLKCDLFGNCVVFVDGNLGDEIDRLTYLTGITGDTDGNIYVSDKDNHRVQVFDEDGTYVATYGIFREPYQVDGIRLNKPVGIAFAPDNSMYITELRGHRLIKLDADGNQVWAVGTPGIFGDDNQHFGNPWSHMQGNPAVGANQRIYVADSPNHRIQVFNADGSFYMSFGEYGQANNQFDFPSSVAVSPVNGDVYVADPYNHRVQVFTSEMVYKSTIGVTNVSGDSNDQFNYPWDIAIDADGSVFVADYDNFRVQKCTLTDIAYNCQTLIGEPGVYNGEFGQFVPRFIAVDVEGRVYVSDDWGSRIQVFDANGAFLTSVGGDWGMKTSQFSMVGGIALNASGDVYVVDADNFRIQKFSIGVPDWTQVNINGFGVTTTESVNSLIEFNDQLYAGTGDWDKGGMIWRSSDGVNWTAVSQPGFGDPANSSITSMIVFDGQLYASTGFGDAAGQVWRSPDGENWVSVVPDGFGNPNNFSVNRFAVYEDVLYASTGNGPDGAEIWRSATGNAGSWTRVVLGGNGNANNIHVNSFMLFDGYLYAAGENENEGAQVWRTSNGADWTVVSANGFGNANNIHIGSIIEFNGLLYVATRNDATGAEIFRSSNGTNWVKVIGSGINNVPDNFKIESLFVFNGHMYAAANNYETGLKVWRSEDGVSYTQLIDNGFGDSNTASTLWNSATTEFKDHLYIGTWNRINGGELWRYNIKPDSGFNIYLPLILK